VNPLQSHGWQTELLQPVKVGKRTLRTLHDVRDYVIRLPKRESESEPWQTVMQTLLFSAPSGCSQFVELALYRAINGEEPEKVFNPDFKEPKWGRKKKDPWRD
jgi:hypothetical protein